MTTALLIVGVAVEALTGALLLVAFMCLRRVARQLRAAARQQQDDMLALLTFVEVQTRKTRHAVKNLAAAMQMQAVASELEAAANDVDEEVASR